ncbi:hypothetical protein PUV54_10545 [Hyphococcus flavus]|uniref:Tissue inhibitor of metalloproteinase n=1 Tax=Hyphococcus flavus TaxID=1866326 RepID=A0AAE9ZGG0_9PROT|nr:hypothetical protein [Hyphococcus flavus]WDI30396.1 hypothetical protein PUV54_10545 [Hyphococcus flavus]
MFRSLFATISVLFLFTSQAIACSCAQFESIEEHVGISDVIFIGAAEKTGRTLSGLFGSEYNRSTRFSVAEMLKGEKDEKLFVTHYLSLDYGANCGLTFEKGVEYLVFAFRRQNGSLTTHSCMRTRKKSEFPDGLLEEYREVINPG